MVAYVNHKYEYANEAKRGEFERLFLNETLANVVDVQSGLLLIRTDSSIVCPVEETIVGHGHCVANLRALVGGQRRELR